MIPTNETLELGLVVETRGVYEKCGKDLNFEKFVWDCLRRYWKLDWGDTCEEDKEQNDKAIREGERVMAEYRHPKKEEWRIWIITEWDRSVTTVLFPEEY